MNTEPNMKYFIEETRNTKSFEATIEELVSCYKSGKLLGDQSVRMTVDGEYRWSIVSDICKNAKSSAGQPLLDPTDAAQATQDYPPSFGVTDFVCTECHAAFAGQQKPARTKRTVKISVIVCVVLFCLLASTFLRTYTVSYVTREGVGVNCKVRVIRKNKNSVTFVDSQWKRQTVSAPYIIRDVTTLADLNAQGYDIDASQNIPGQQKPKDTQVLLGFGSSQLHFTAVLQEWTFKHVVTYERFNDTTMIACYDKGF
jgi:hypothetical protein